MASPFIDALVTTPATPKRPPPATATSGFISSILGPGGAVDEFAKKRQKSVGALEAQGVDVTTGLDMGTRASLSAREAIPGLRKEFLDKTFSNHRETPVGTVVTLPDGKEMLVDEEGITFNDVADLVDEGIVTAGAVAGALATIPTTLGLLGAAAVTAVAGQGVGAVKDIALLLKDRGTFDGFQEVLGRRGLDGGIDFLMDVATGGAARFAKGAQNLITAPFGGSAAKAGPTATRQAAEELGVTTLRPSEVTGSKALAGFESLVSKIPGSTSAITDATDVATDTRIRQIVNGLAENAPNHKELGDAITAVFNQNADEAAATINSLKTQAREKALENVDSASLNISRAKIGVDDAGANGRTRLTELRDNARADNGALYDRVFALQEASLPVFKAARLKKFGKKLRSQFPQERVTKTKEVLPARVSSRGTRRAITKTTAKSETATAFLPTEAKRFLSSIASLEDMTLEQAIKGRGAINAAITEGSALSDVGEGILKKFSSELTKIIEEGTAKLPSGRLKSTLDMANADFKTSVLPFQEKGIAQLFKAVGQPGFVEDNTLVRRLFLESRQGERARLQTMLGADSPQWRDIRKAMFTDILSESGSLLKGNTVDPKVMLAKLGSMKAGARGDLLGDQEASIIQSLREAVSAGDLDLSTLPKTGGDIATMIRSAATKKRALDTQYKNEVIGKFLKGELDSSAIAPEEFTNHFLRDAGLDEIGQVFNALGPNSELATKLRKRVIMDVLERSRRGGATGLDIIESQFGEGNPVGPNLLQVLKTSYGKSSELKMEKILGADTLQTLKNLGVLASARATRQQMGDAAGGIVAGIVRTGILLGKVAVLPSLIKYRIAAAVLASPAMRKFANLQKAHVPISNEARAAALATPQVLGVIRAEFEDDPELADSIVNEFANAAKQLPAVIGDAVTGAAQNFSEGR